MCVISACSLRMLSVWFAFSLRIVSVRYTNSNIEHGLLIQHPMNMFLYHQVQSTLKFVMNTHYYVIYALRSHDFLVQLFSYPSLIAEETYRYRCLIIFPFSKLNPSQNGQSILLLCHDNPPEVSRIARFCTNFIFEKNLSRTQTASESHRFLTVKHMRC